MIFNSSHGVAIKVLWYPKMDQNICFKFGEVRSIVCYCTQKEKMNFEGFSQNGCYGYQPQPLRLYFIVLTPTVPVLLQNKI